MWSAAPHDGRSGDDADHHGKGPMEQRSGQKLPADQRALVLNQALDEIEKLSRTSQNHMEIDQVGLFDSRDRQHRHTSMGQAITGASKAHSSSWAPNPVAESGAWLPVIGQQQNQLSSSSWQDPANTTEEDPYAKAQRILHEASFDRSSDGYGFDLLGGGILAGAPVDKDYRRKQPGYSGHARSRSRSPVVKRGGGKTRRSRSRTSSAESYRSKGRGRRHDRRRKRSRSPISRRKRLPAADRLSNSASSASPDPVERDQQDSQSGDGYNSGEELQKQLAAYWQKTQNFASPQKQITERSKSNHNQKPVEDDETLYNYNPDPTDFFFQLEREKTGAINYGAVSAGGGESTTRGEQSIPWNSTARGDSGSKSAREPSDKLQQIERSSYGGRKKSRTPPRERRRSFSRRSSHSSKHTTDRKDGSNRSSSKQKDEPTRRDKDTKKDGKIVETKGSAASGGSKTTVDDKSSSIPSETGTSSANDAKPAEPNARKSRFDTIANVKLKPGAKVANLPAPTVVVPPAEDKTPTSNASESVAANGPAPKFFPTPVSTRPAAPPSVSQAPITQWPMMHSGQFGQPGAPPPPPVPQPPPPGPPGFEHMPGPPPLLYPHGIGHHHQPPAPPPFDFIMHPRPPLPPPHELPGLGPPFRPPVPPGPPMPSYLNPEHLPPGAHPGPPFGMPHHPGFRPPPLHEFLPPPGGQRPLPPPLDYRPIPPHMLPPHPQHPHPLMPPRPQQLMPPHLQPLMPPHSQPLMPPHSQPLMPPHLHHPNPLMPPFMPDPHAFPIHPPPTAVSQPPALPPIPVANIRQPEMKDTAATGKHPSTNAGDDEDQDIPNIFALISQRHKELLGKKDAK